MWTLYWKDYYFAAGFHVGLKKFYAEIHNMKKNKMEEEVIEFKSLEEAIEYFRKYGYSNANRFLTEEDSCA
jgi:predicted DNA-binding protein (MmcQ/YjbR family)